MSSIRTELVALDTNEFLFGIRGDAAHSASALLVLDNLHLLRLFIAAEVNREVFRNLAKFEELAYDSVIKTAAEVTWGATAADSLHDKFKLLGAKKGDAAIAAELDAAGVKWLVSENRHFLAEIPGLPFQVISAEEALAMLSQSE